MSEKSNGGNSGSRMFMVIALLLVVVLVVVAAVVLLGGGGIGAKPIESKAATRNLRNFVLRPEDFAIAYFQDGGSETPISNEEVILAMGQARGKQYVTATGRVEGWEITLLRSNDTDIAPQKYKNQVHVFETVDGAKLAFSPEWFWPYTDEAMAPSDFLDNNCSIGDECLLWVYEDYKAASGLTVLQYDLAFRYRNVIVWVSATGLMDVDITESDVIDAAQIILDKIKSSE